MKYINLKPIAPTIRGFNLMLNLVFSIQKCCLIKIHKEDSPIRPTVNWKNAQAYKLANMLSKISRHTFPFPYTFNVKNTVHLINDLLVIPYDQNLKFVSFDITNMYSNVPTNELIETTYIICDKQGISEEMKHEITKISQIIIKENFFQFQNTLMYKKKDLLWVHHLQLYFLKYTNNTLKTQ